MTEPDVVEMPMFPLGSVLFPSGVLPLHIFEIRYQQLLNHALESDRRFGVVLISRGSEVGGGESRNDVGTVAEIVEHQRFDDGRAAVVSRGTDRFEVIEWLEDRPYPFARVRLFDAEPASADDRTLLDQAQQRFAEVLELGQRLGRIESMPDMDWSEDLDDASWQLAVRSPCTAHDQYQVLSAATRASRLERLDTLLQGVYADLELMGGLDSSS